MVSANKTGTSATSASRKRRVFIAEDHPIFLHGLVQLINSQPDLEVCGTAASAPKALSGLRENCCDAAVVDISLKGPNGLELIKHIRTEHQHLPILVLSMHDESVYAMRALRAGAGGYLMKGEDPETFVHGLRKVMNGQTAVSDEFSQQLIYQVASGHGRANAVNNLSDRELEVLDLVGRGRASREIAADLNLSIKTVESHRLRIKEKLGLRNAADMVRFALEWVSLEKGLPVPVQQNGTGADGSEE